MVVPDRSLIDVRTIVSIIKKEYKLVCQQIAIVALLQPTFFLCCAWPIRQSFLEVSSIGFCVACTDPRVLCALTCSLTSSACVSLSRMGRMLSMTREPCSAMMRSISCNGKTDKLMPEMTCCRFAVDWHVARRLNHAAAVSWGIGFRAVRSGFASSAGVRFGKRMKAEFTRMTKRDQSAASEQCVTGRPSSISADLTSSRAHWNDKARDGRPIKRPERPLMWRHTRGAGIGGDVPATLSRLRLVPSPPPPAISAPVLQERETSGTQGYVPAEQQKTRWRIKWTFANAPQESATQRDPSLNCSNRIEMWRVTSRPDSKFRMRPSVFMVTWISGSFSRLKFAERASYSSERASNRSANHPRSQGLFLQPPRGPWNEVERDTALSRGATHLNSCDGPRTSRILFFVCSSAWYAMFCQRKTSTENGRITREHASTRTDTRTLNSASTDE